MLTAPDRRPTREFRSSERGGRDTHALQSLTTVFMTGKALEQIKQVLEWVGAGAGQRGPAPAQIKHWATVFNRKNNTQREDRVAIDLKIAIALLTDV